MAIFKEGPASIRKLGDWLVDSRSEDTHGKWAIRALDPDVSITSTAEALLCLSDIKDKYTDETFEAAINELKKFANQNELINTRYAAEILLVLLKFGNDANNSTIKNCVAYLIDDEIKGSEYGWKYNRSSKKSSTYPTFLAFWALTELYQNTKGSEFPPEDKVLTRCLDARSWLINAQNEDGGWGFKYGDGKSNCACTAYVLSIVDKLRGIHDKKVFDGVNFLLDNKKSWEQDSETINNTEIKVYKHFSAAWALVGLTKVAEHYKISGLNTECCYALSNLMQFGSEEGGFVADRSLSQKNSTFATAWALKALTNFYMYLINNVYIFDDICNGLDDLKDSVEILEEKLGRLKSYPQNDIINIRIIDGKYWIKLSNSLFKIISLFSITVFPITVGGIYYVLNNLILLKSMLTINILLIGALCFIYLQNKCLKEPEFTKAEAIGLAGIIISIISGLIGIIIVYI